MASDLKSLNNYVVKLKEYDRVNVIHCGRVT